MRAQELPIPAMCYHHCHWGFLPCGGNGWATTHQGQCRRETQGCPIILSPACPIHAPRTPLLQAATHPSPLQDPTTFYFPRGSHSSYRLKIIHTFWTYCTSKAQFGGGTLALFGHLFRNQAESLDLCVLGMSILTHPPDSVTSPWEQRSPLTSPWTLASDTDPDTCKEMRERRA